MSNLVSFEPLVDSTMKYFFTRLDELFVHTGHVCDLDTWLQMFAFDTMGEITFSKRFGFLEKGEDVNNIMANIWKYFVDASPVRSLPSNQPCLCYICPCLFRYVQITQMPWFDYIWTKNPLVQQFQVIKPNPIVKFAMDNAAARKTMSQSEYDEKAHLYSRDFLTRISEAELKAPDVPPW